MAYLERNGVAWAIPEYHGIAERYRKEIYLPWDNWQVKESLQNYKLGRFGELRKESHATGNNVNPRT